MLPPKFIYENAEAYFKGELDERTSKNWEMAVKAINKSFQNKKYNSYLWLPFIFGLLFK